MGTVQGFVKYYLFSEICLQAWKPYLIIK